MEYDEELKTFIKVWFFAFLSTCYCYLIPTRITNGVPRLLLILPVIIVFLVAPLPLSTIHLTFTTFLYLAWLGNFKLLMYAFNYGPLASTPPLPFVTFVSIALFPINRKHSIKRTSAASAPTPAHNLTLLAFKALIQPLIIVACHYKDNINQNVILVLYICYMYFSVELGYAISALFVQIFMGFKFEMEPQFKEPYLATSLQDFWGRRWNLIVSSILRPFIYNPIREITIPVLGKLLSQMLAIVVTFVVSGLMHELMYLYLTRVRPTWEVTWFFVLHGVCNAVEVAIKKVVNGRFRLHKVVSGSLTLLFVMVTTAWLFLAQPLRNGVESKIINENSYLLLWE